MSFPIPFLRDRLPWFYIPARRAVFAVRTLGPVHGLRYIATESGGPSNRCKVWCRKLDADVYLRTRSADLEVLYQALIRDDYQVALPEPVETIIDAGAHIGFTTAAFARRFPQAQVIAIEPEAGNYELLCRNTAHLPNVRPLRAALSDSKGTVELRDRGTGSLGFSIFADAVGSVTHESVRSLSLRDLMEELQVKRVDLLKLNIEGAEVEVLRSLGPVIQSVRAIVVDLHDRFRPGCTDAFNRLTETGWSVQKRRDIAFARQQPQAENQHSAISGSPASLA